MKKHAKQRRSKNNKRRNIDRFMALFIYKPAVNGQSYHHRYQKGTLHDNENGAAVQIIDHIKQHERHKNIERAVRAHVHGDVNTARFVFKQRQKVFNERFTLGRVVLHGLNFPRAEIQ